VTTGNFIPDSDAANRSGSKNSASAYNEFTQTSSFCLGFCKPLFATGRVDWGGILWCFQQVLHVQQSLAEGSVPSASDVNFRASAGIAGTLEQRPLPFRFHVSLCNGRVC
jgi:hypothetical protein